MPDPIHLHIHPLPNLDPSNFFQPPPSSFPYFHPHPLLHYPLFIPTKSLPPLILPHATYTQTSTPTMLPPTTPPSPHLSFMQPYISLPNSPHVPSDLQPTSSPTPSNPSLSTKVHTEKECPCPLQMSSVDLRKVWRRAETFFTGYSVPLRRSSLCTGVLPLLYMTTRLQAL